MLVFLVCFGFLGFVWFCEFQFFVWVLWGLFVGFGLVLLLVWFGRGGGFGRWFLVFCGSSTCFSFSSYHLKLHISLSAIELSLTLSITSTAFSSILLPVV